MAALTNVPMQISQALHEHRDRTALADSTTTLRYGELADLIGRMQPFLSTETPLAVFGKPSTLFGAAVTACVVLGRAFVHLDPAMPNEVLQNILKELLIETVFCCERAEVAKIPSEYSCIDVSALAVGLNDQPSHPIKAAQVTDRDVIYIVATSGTTGKPKCIPVTHRSAFLSYEWRDAYTPYGPGDRVGAYIFAIWEIFRPLRTGARVQFARFQDLMNPRDLVCFWQKTGVTEMLFTPSALEKTLTALPDHPIENLSLQRIILNGEVVGDALITAVRQRLPDVTLWNLYSICETHDISMTNVTGRERSGGPVSVGVPMPYLRAIVLDDHDEICPIGQAGLLHFEGADMLGPGYINRPNETALRFRALTLEGHVRRLYDTGDQGYIDADGAVHVIGRIAHMLKLRGHSIQTRELTESLENYLSFGQAVPWIKDVKGQGKTLVLYYTCDADQADRNTKNFGIVSGQMRLPPVLSKVLRKALPTYCIPGYLVQLDEVPINAVSGKYDFKRLPEIEPIFAIGGNTTDLPTLIEGAKVMGCAVDELDPGLSFHAQGGDSLMAVTLLLSLEQVYGRPVDFDFALNVPLGRLHDLLSAAEQRPEARKEFTRPGILLTGATGFLGGRVLAAAARTLPKGHAIYCVVRERRNVPMDRLRTTAQAQGVNPERLVLISAAIEDAQFGLDDQSYKSLASCVTTVIHCAAMVNLAVDRGHSEKWSQNGIANILQFCTDAAADLRFTSSSAVFPDSGGLFQEAATALFDGCSGYGASKIEAEAQIVSSGINAAIVRLPSLYDLKIPNEKDIYEIIMTACNRIKAVPEGFMFRMVDVHAAAIFIVGLRPGDGVNYYNFAPDIWVDPNLIPQGYATLSQDVWIKDAGLSDAERALIAADKTVLHAASRFYHKASQTEWEETTRTGFAQTSNPTALINARLTNSSRH
ncbi:MAG: AMP-binding protein [Pseudoruegeria sp.]